MRHAVVLAAAAAALGLGEPMLERTTYQRGRAPRVMHRQYVPPFVAPATNGKREVARRLRQITAGQLRVTETHVAEAV